MVREQEEIPEVVRAKLRLRAVAGRPAELPAAMRAAPGILRLLRPMRPAASASAGPAATAVPTDRALGRTLLALAGVATAAAAAGFLLSRSPQTRRAAGALLMRSVRGRP